MPDPLVSLFVFFITLGVIAVAFWPRKGLVSRLQRLAHLDERTSLEDALKHLYTCHSADRQTSLESLPGQLETSRAHAATLLSRLTEMGLVSATTQGLTLQKTACSPLYDLSAHIECGSGTWPTAPVFPLRNGTTKPNVWNTRYHRQK